MQYRWTEYRTMTLQTCTPKHNHLPPRTADKQNVFCFDFLTWSPLAPLCPCCPRGPACPWNERLCQWKLITTTSPRTVYGNHNCRHSQVVQELQVFLSLHPRQFDPEKERDNIGTIIIIVILRFSGVMGLTLYPGSPGSPLSPLSPGEPWWNIEHVSKL